jgi:hypothetical protein
MAYIMKNCTITLDVTTLNKSKWLQIKLSQNDIFKC